MGVEKVEQPVEPVGWMERWDDRIRDVGNKVCCFWMLHEFEN